MPISRRPTDAAPSQPGVTMPGSSLLAWWPKAWNPFARRKDSSASDYETVLASLALEIEEVEATLYDIKARKRNTIRTTLAYLISVWVALVAVVWAIASMRSGPGSGLWAYMHSASVLGLVLGTPVFIVVLHRVLSMWYGRLEHAQGTCHSAY